MTWRVSFWSFNLQPPQIETPDNIAVRCHVKATWEDVLCQQKIPVWSSGPEQHVDQFSLTSATTSLFHFVILAIWNNKHNHLRRMNVNILIIIGLIWFQIFLRITLWPCFTIKSMIGIWMSSRQFSQTKPDSLFPRQATVPTNGKYDAVPFLRGHLLKPPTEHRVQTCRDLTWGFTLLLEEKAGYR